MIEDDQFFDLALKVATGKASEAERGELNATLARQPELKAEFERVREDARLAQELLPLLEATEAVGGELPGYARGRLQSKVRETFGRPSPSRQSERANELSKLWPDRKSTRLNSSHIPLSR